jgi:hypothetical protein
MSGMRSRRVEIRLCDAGFNNRVGGGRGQRGRRVDVVRTDRDPALTTPENEVLVLEKRGT